MLNVSNIQRVCFHDGPGIRTTVFLNSCLLKCPWCANPETSKLTKKYVLNDNCKKEKCPFNIDCNGIKSSMEELENNYIRCPIGAIEKTQNLYSIDDLYKLLINDKFLYENNGGVTFSGGEPLLQSKNLSKLMKKLADNNINIAMETCLFASKTMLEDVINYVDLFIVDIKILDTEKCLKILGGNLDLFFENINLIFSKEKKVIFRIPLIEPYITNKENMGKIYSFLKTYKPLKVEIFKGHNLAKEKYYKLGLKYEDVKTISDEDIKLIKKIIEDLGIETQVIKF